MTLKTIGLDLTKNVFRIHRISETGRKLFIREIDRAKLHPEKVDIWTARILAGKPLRLATVATAKKRPVSSGPCYLGHADETGKLLAAGHLTGQPARDARRIT